MSVTRSRSSSASNHPGQQALPAIRGTAWAIVWAYLLALPCAAWAAEDWPQFQFDARRSGDAADRSVSTPLGLIAAAALDDAIFTSPAVADGQVYVVDGAGTAWCLDVETLRVVWRRATRDAAATAAQSDNAGSDGVHPPASQSGTAQPTVRASCNNLSSPAVVGAYLHFGATAGSYYVLDRSDGRIVREIRCRGPIFTAPTVANGRAYFATVGAEVYAVEPDGTVAWTWDFVREVIGFTGDRWRGQDWLDFKHGRVTWKDHFCCSRDLAAYGKTLVIPAGGRVVFLADEGDHPRVRTVGQIPNFHGNEYPAAFGLSLGPQGEAYVQWHRRDNAGRVEILRLREDDTIEASYVPGTQTAIDLPGLLSFCSVGVRGSDVYRCRPEQGFGLCRHTAARETPETLAAYPSIAPPVLLRDQAVVGGLDGRLYVAPLSGTAPGWSFATAFGKPITAPAAVCDGRVYFGCEDGYLYALGPDGRAALPTRDLGLERIRSPLSGPSADAKYDWYTNYGNMQNTNTTDQELAAPLRIKWLRRYEGTFKHLPVCGGGRMYTHTSEGQIFAVEQETGRLLWRRYWPGVYLSFTSPLYYRTKTGAAKQETRDEPSFSDERLLVPQAGMGQSRMRCLDAATGKLVWEAPFTGSPSWSRQAPPVIWENLAIYASGSGRYAAQGTEKPFIFSGTPIPAADGGEVMSWIYTHDNPYYPKDNRPLVWAWDLETGRLVWQREFSQYGTGGNDCGLCLMDGRLYYSTFFGYSASQRKRRGLPAGPNGITAALDPRTGDVLWLTGQYYVTAGCTISGDDGRLYLGGYNQPDEGGRERFVFCLDARDGSLVWRSEGVRSAVNVISIGKDYVFSNASGGDGHVFDRQTGKIVSRFNFGYACTRFTCAGPFVLGANMDLIDLRQDNRLVTTGPSIDSRECVAAVLSNGRLFYTSQASGLQVCQVAGDEAQQAVAPWERP